MDALVPWAEFCSVIEAYYLSISKAGDGRRLIGMRPGQVGAGFHSADGQHNPGRRESEARGYPALFVQPKIRWLGDCHSAAYPAK